MKFQSLFLLSLLSTTLAKNQRIRGTTIKRQGPATANRLKRIKAATKLIKNKSKNTKPSSKTTTKITDPECDYHDDDQEAATNKMNILLSTNSQQNFLSCKIIANSCFPQEFPGSSNNTAGLQQQLSNLAQIRSSSNLDREQSRLLVISALRCDWTVNDRMCVMKDDEQSVGEKLAYFQKAYQLASPGSDGYKMIQKQLQICEEKNKGIIDEEMAEEETQVVDTVDQTS